MSIKVDRHGIAEGPNGISGYLQKLKSRGQENYGSAECHTEHKMKRGYNKAV